jgi:hypothetical protein
VKKALFAAVLAAPELTVPEKIEPDRSARTFLAIK